MKVGSCGGFGNGQTQPTAGASPTGRGSVSSFWMARSGFAPTRTSRAGPQSRNHRATGGNPRGGSPRPPDTSAVVVGGAHARASPVAATAAARRAVAMVHAVCLGAAQVHTSYFYTRCSFSAHVGLPRHNETHPVPSMKHPHGAFAHVALPCDASSHPYCTTSCAPCLLFLFYPIFS